MSSHSKRSGAIRTGLVALLLVPILLAIWVATYLWVERSSRELIYRKNASAQGISRLEAWAPLMFYPSRWTWLKADAYRKLGDRPRVSRLVDEMAAKGLPIAKASSPLWLLESAAGMPSKVKDNLGPLLLVYKSDGGEVLASLVQGFLNQGDRSSADQALRLWNELYEQDPKAAFWQGVFSTANYDLDTALESFQRAIELDPKEPRARQELAEVYLEKANFEEARAMFEWLMKNDHETPEVITGYARSLLNLGLTEEASLELKKLADVSKLPSPELALVCETNLEAGQAELASQQATMLLKRWPKALPYLQLKARSLAKLGETSESEKYFAQAAESQNKRPQIDQMIERLATDSANQELRRDMGQMMMDYLDPAGGVGYIQIASRSNPFDIQSQELLVSYYEKEGDLQVAQNHRRMIRQIEQQVLNPMEMSEPPPVATPQPPAALPQP
jgi:tetratricopeptide (TPR) repeat protein